MTREEIKAAANRRETLENCYNETVVNGNKPADAIARCVAVIGYEETKKAVAELVNNVGEWDRRLDRRCREYASGIADALSRDQLESAYIYGGAIHSAHVNQIVTAMEKYIPAEAVETVEAVEAVETAETAGGAIQANDDECNETSGAVRERIFELIPGKYEHVKSFYGKAKVIIKDSGETVLRSYDTDVCKVNKNGEFVRLWDGYSATTMRHVNSFLEALHIPIGDKCWWNNQAVRA